MGIICRKFGSKMLLEGRQKNLECFTSERHGASIWEINDRGKLFRFSKSLEDFFFIICDNVTIPDFIYDTILGKVIGSIFDAYGFDFSYLRYFECVGSGTRILDVVPILCRSQIVRFFSISTTSICIPVHDNEPPDLFQKLCRSQRSSVNLQ